ncbi:hypothetical protein FAQ69_06595, partial [Klebsiella pneumoniae subsp. pneumoniae]
MAKIGDGVPRLIDKAVDFMASSQAFMEYLKKSPRLQHVPRDIPQDKEAGNDSNLLIVFYVQIMPDDFVMQLHR